jgi:hypothetical protein
MRTIHLDLSGLEDFRLATRPPIFSEQPALRKRTSFLCPECQKPLLDFIQDDRLMFYCKDCRIVWPTTYQGCARPASEKLKKAFIMADEIEEAA